MNESSSFRIEATAIVRKFPKDLLLGSPVVSQNVLCTFIASLRMCTRFTSSKSVLYSCSCNNFLQQSSKCWVYSNLYRLPSRLHRLIVLE